MAISYVSAVVGNSGISTTTDTVTIGAPGLGAQVGDLGVVFLAGSANALTMLSAPSGWTLLGSGTGAGATTFWAYCKIFTLGDLSGSKSWQMSASGRPCGTMDIFRGVDATTPVEASSIPTPHASASTSDAPAITTLTDDAWIVSAWSARDTSGGAATITVPGTHTARATVGTGFASGGINTSLQTGTLTTTGPAGTYGPYTASLSPAGSSGVASLALRQSGATPTVNPGQFFAML